MAKTKQTTDKSVEPAQVTVEANLLTQLIERITLNEFITDYMLNVQENESDKASVYQNLVTYSPEHADLHRKLSRVYAIFGDEVYDLDNLFDIAHNASEVIVRVFSLERDCTLADFTYNLTNSRTILVPGISQIQRARVTLGKLVKFLDERVAVIIDDLVDAGNKLFSLDITIIAENKEYHVRQQLSFDDK